MTYQKTFGITKLQSGRFAIVSDIETSIDRFGNPFTTKHIHYDLSYKKPEFAIKQSEQFIKACHKPFVNFQGEKVDFKFVNMGMIEN